MSKQTAGLVEKLRQQLQLAPGQEGVSWYELLRVVLLSSDFSDIIASLVEESTEVLPERFTPPLKTIFRPFQLVPPSKLKVVLIAPGPWSELEQADGLALSSPKSKTVLLPEELLNLLSAIRTEFDQPQRGDTNLQRWADQGVLLLNRSLTIGVDRKKISLVKHTKRWQTFFNYLHEILITQYPLVPRIYYGDVGDLIYDLTDEEIAHSYGAGYVSYGRFDVAALAMHNVNKDLVSQGQTPINW